MQFIAWMPQPQRSNDNPNQFSSELEYYRQSLIHLQQQQDKIHKETLKCRQEVNKNNEELWRLKHKSLETSGERKKHKIQRKISKRQIALQRNKRKSIEILQSTEDIQNRILELNRKAVLAEENQEVLTEMSKRTNQFSDDQLMVLLLERSLSEDSPFYRETMPIDVFEKILELAIVD